MKLSKNFTLAEFEASGTASRLGIDNTIPDVLISRVQQQVDAFLQPVRDEFGPVTITSGYRCPKLNARIGGAATSQHSVAEATDFKVAGVSHKKVCDWIVANCDFDQLIYEFGEGGWIHCSYRSPSRNRKQVLRAVKTTIKGRRRTVYRKGLR